MNLYIALNGDCSSQMMVFAKDAKTARRLLKKKIKNEELEEKFPVLCLDKHPVKQGVIDYIIDLKEF